MIKYSFVIFLIAICAFAQPNKARPGIIPMDLGAKENLSRSTSDVNPPAQDELTAAENPFPFNPMLADVFTTIPDIGKENLKLVEENLLGISKNKNRRALDILTYYLRKPARDDIDPKAVYKRLELLIKHADQFGSDLSGESHATHGSDNGWEMLRLAAREAEITVLIRLQRLPDPQYSGKLAQR